MEIIAILDFTVGDVQILKYDGDGDSENWLKKNGYNPGDCQWMITDSSNLNINL